MGGTPLPLSMRAEKEEVYKAKSHEHYGPEVQFALRRFIEVWGGARDLHLRRMRDNDFRLDTVQDAFNKLVRARVKETGTGFYLDSTQHAKAVDNLKNRN